MLPICCATRATPFSDITAIHETYSLPEGAAFLLPTLMVENRRELRSKLGGIRFPISRSPIWRWRTAPMGPVQRSEGKGFQVGWNGSHVMCRAMEQHALEVARIANTEVSGQIRKSSTVIIFPSHMYGLGQKAIPGLGESFYCSCLPLLPQFACRIHTTWGPRFSWAL